MLTLKTFLLVSFSLVFFSANVFSQVEEVFLPGDFKQSPYVAQYSRGEVGWFNSVENRVRYRNFPQGSPQDTISIVMQFFVPRDGKIREVVFCAGDKRIERPVRKVLLKSGNWIPAMQGGRSVKSYRKVKFQFRFDSMSREWVFDRNASAYLLL